MATIVDALIITLGVDPSGVQRGMDSAQQTVASGAKKIASALSTPLLSILAGFSVGSVVSQYVDAATSIDRLSSSLGMSIEELQGWQYAAESAGAEASEIGNFFRDLSDYIVDATTFDSGPLKDIAKELGISLRDAQGDIRATTDIALDLADALQAAGQQRAVAFGMQMSIDPAMIALLQRGREEIEGLISAQQRLGGYTRDDAEAATAAKFAFLTLSRSIEAAAIPIVRMAIPAVTWLAERITDLVVLIRDNAQFVNVAIGLIAATITAKLVPAIIATGVAATRAALPFLPLIAVIGGIALVIDDLISYIMGGKSALSGLWEVFGTGAELLSFFTRVWDGLVSTLDRIRGITPYIAKAAGVLVGLYTASRAVSAVTTAVTALRGAFSALRVVLAANPLGLLLTAAALIITYWDEIIAGVKIVGDTVATAMTYAGEVIQSVWSSIFDWFGDKIAWITDAISGVMDLPKRAIDTIAQYTDSALNGMINIFSGGESPSSADSIPGAVYNAPASGASAVSNSMTINGGINIQGAEDPEQTGRAVTNALRDRAGLVFVVDTGVRQ